MSVLAPTPSMGVGGLYLRCLGWGVTTGAATGGLAGAIGAVGLVIGGNSGLAGAVLLYGTVVGRWSPSSAACSAPRSWRW